MSIVLMFMFAATVAPFIFKHLKKTALAILQIVLLVGMWLYFFETMFHVAPAPFSLTWAMFYVSLVVSEVAWVMLIINMVHSPAKHHRHSYQ